MKIVMLYLMNLFTKKPSEKTKAEKLLSYNVEDLSSKMHQYSIEVFRCRTEDSMRVLKKVVETARNIQILEVNRSSKEKIDHHLGRLEALSDLASFIEHSLDPEEYSKKIDKQAPRVKVLTRNTQKSEAVI